MVDFLMRLVVIEKKVAARYESATYSDDDESPRDAEDQDRDEEADEETPLVNSSDRNNAVVDEIEEE